MKIEFHTCSRLTLTGSLQEKDSPRQYLGTFDDKDILNISTEVGNLAELDKKLSQMCKHMPEFKELADKLYDQAVVKYEELEAKHKADHPKAECL